MHLVTWLFVGLLGLLLAIAFLSQFSCSFSGLWERIDSATPIARRERIRLAQFGFILLGTRKVVGGKQSFLGLAFGPFAWLRRRDYGIRFLGKEGFPEPIAKQVEGQVMAKYQLKLKCDQNLLEGSFIPYKVEFTIQPAQVTAMHPQDPLPRKYRRIETIVETEPAFTAS